MGSEAPGRDDKVHLISVYLGFLCTVWKVGERRSGKRMYRNI